MDMRDKRTEIEIPANISDGKRVFEGMVVDISREGFRMKEVPEKFNFYSDKYTAVITYKDKNFKLFLSPRWSKTEGTYKEVGFKIISPPIDWLRFVNNLLDEEVAVNPAYH